MEVRPGPRVFETPPCPQKLTQTPGLNLVLGANGTGKSAVACAIGLVRCLRLQPRRLTPATQGLGGTTKIVSRSQDIKGYIKNDQQTALIEIELQGDPGQANPVVKRILSREGKKDEYQVNNKPRNKDEMEKFFSIMNIQVNNLCQYLPQDQVGNFSKFDDKDLLRETVRAVRGEKHARMQDDIVSLQKRLKDDEKSFKSKDEERANKQVENDRLEREVKRQESRQKLLEDIKLRTIKAAWLRFDDARAKFKAAKENVEKVEREVAECRSERLPQLKARLAALKKEVTEAANEASALEVKTKAEMTKQRKAAEEIDNSLTGLKALQVDVASIESRQAQARKKVEEHTKKLATLKSKVDEARTESQLMADLEKLRAEQKKAADKLGELELAVNKASVDVSRVRLAVSAMEKARAPKPAAPLSVDGTARLAEEADAVAALRAMSESIKTAGSKAAVFGPVINYVSCKDAVASRALETHVRKSTWCYFVTTHEADRDAVMARMDAQRRLPGGVMNIAPDAQKAMDAMPRPRFSKETTDRLGLRGFLDEYMVGEPVVIEALRKSDKVHQVIIGSEATERALAADADALRALVEEAYSRGFTGKLSIYTPKFRRDVGQSKYDKNLFTQVRQLEDNPAVGYGRNHGRLVRSPDAALPPPPPQVQNPTASPSKSPEQLKSELARLEAVHEAAKKAAAAGRAEKDRLKTAVDGVLDARTMLRKNADKVQTMTRELRDLEQEASKDWVAALAQERAKLDAAAKDLVGDASVVRAATTRCFEAHAAWVAAALHLEARVAEKDVFDLAVKEAEHDEASGSARIARAKQDEDAARTQAKKLKEAAEKVHPLTEEVKARWDAAGLSDNVDELDVQVKELQYQVDAIHADASVIEQYQQRKSQLQMLEAQLGTLREEIDAKKLLLQKQLLEWKQPVDEMVGKIHTSMQDFFARIAKDGYKCSCQVDLKGDDDDVASYGVVISVKFREEQNLQRLSATVHSGGERSLTTFLYMLSLQTLSKAPFRLVDEINQGMDADKERLAFYRLQAVATGHKTPQYFVITPKLLPGLRYTPDTTVLFVFNGFFNIDQKDWNVDKFIAARRAAASGGGKRARLQDGAAAPVEEEEVEA